MIPLHSLGLQAPTEDVKVVLEETFGGEEGIYFTSVMPCGSNFHFSTCISPTIVSSLPMQTAQLCLNASGSEGGRE